MRPIAESTAEQPTITTARHQQEESDIDDNDSSGVDIVDGKIPHNISDLTYITQNEDGSSDNKVTDTTTKGGMLGGKTASGMTC
jgi:hypothetical protein